MTSGAQSMESMEKLETIFRELRDFCYENLDTLKEIKDEVITANNRIDVSGEQVMEVGDVCSAWRMRYWSSWSNKSSWKVGW